MEGNMSDTLEDIRTAIVDRRHQTIEDLVRGAVAQQIPVEEIINDGLIAAMDEVGRQFSQSLIFVPEMLVSALAMKKGLEVIKPLLSGHEGKPRGKVVLCTVKGDLHDIGKNLVAMMLEGAGLAVFDLGVDVTVDQVVAKVAEIQPDVLGMSALLTTTMPEMQRVVEQLAASGMRRGVKIMIGGAPVSETFAEKIGADAYGKDAAEAVAVARRLIAKA